jgi:hypothetical protein
VAAGVGCALAAELIRQSQRLPLRHVARIAPDRLPTTITFSDSVRHRGPFLSKSQKWVGGRPALCLGCAAKDQPPWLPLLPMGNSAAWQQQARPSRVPTRAGAPTASHGKTGSRFAMAPGLLRQARATRFGQAHRFGRLRDVTSAAEPKLSGRCIFLCQRINDGRGDEPLSCASSAPGAVARGPMPSYMARDALRVAPKYQRSVGK